MKLVGFWQFRRVIAQMQMGRKLKQYGEARKTDIQFQGTKGGRENKKFRGT